MNCYTNIGKTEEELTGRCIPKDGSAFKKLFNHCTAAFIVLYAEWSPQKGNISRKPTTLWGPPLYSRQQTVALYCGAGCKEPAKHSPQTR